MARYRDDGEVQIDNSTNGRFRIAFQWLIEIVAFNVGTLLTVSKMIVTLHSLGVCAIASHILARQAVRTTQNDAASLR